MNVFVLLMKVVFLSGINHSVSFLLGLDYNEICDDEVLCTHTTDLTIKALFAEVSVMMKAVYALSSLIGSQLRSFH